MIRTFLRSMLKPLSFLPALCMMVVIYSFSAEDGASSSAFTYKVSVKVVEAVDRVADLDLSQAEIEHYADRFHFLIRKCGHVTEYFLLAVSIALPLYVYGMRGIWLMLVAGSICVGFASLDEYHQLFVAGRGASKRDVAIDSIGIFSGIILTRIVGWTGRKTIFRPLCKKKKKRYRNAGA